MFSVFNPLEIRLWYTHCIAVCWWWEQPDLGLWSSYHQRILTLRHFLKNLFLYLQIQNICPNICILLVQNNKNLIICFDCAYFLFILIILMVVSPMLKIIHVIVRWAISWIWIFNQASVSAEYASIQRFVRERTKLLFRMEQTRIERSENRVCVTSLWMNTHSGRSLQTLAMAASTRPSKPAHFWGMISTLK